MIAGSICVAALQDRVKELEARLAESELRRSETVMAAELLQTDLSAARQRIAELEKLARAHAAPSVNVGAHSLARLILDVLEGSEPKP